MAAEGQKFSFVGKQYESKQIFFVQKLQERGIEADCFEVPDMDHFNLVENLSKEEYILTKTIISIVKSGEINKV